jgi:hypothetical protein
MTTGDLKDNAEEVLARYGRGALVGREAVPFGAATASAQRSASGQDVTELRVRSRREFVETGSPIFRRFKSA